MLTSDKNILQLIDHLKQLGRFEFDYEFCERIGLLSQNLIRIKQGLTHFTPAHIEMICKIYKVNANWIFGLSKKMFNDRNSKGLVEKIKAQKSVQII